MANSRPTINGVRVGAVQVSFSFVDVGPHALRLVGELDIAAVPTLRDRLADAVGDIELDCGGLTFVDAAGLRLLVALHQACECRGSKLAIVNPSRCVVRLLALTGADALLDAQPGSRHP